MKHRKLRIAWSVVWGFAAVLLIVLWVRSCWSADVFTFPVSSSRLVGFGSVQGGTTAYTGGYTPGYFQGLWELRSFIVVDPRIADYRAQASPQYRGRFGFGVIRSPPFLTVGAPHWFFVGIALTLATVPWLHKLSWRFSLRNLLIATTLVAVVLGVIVAVLR